MNHIAFVFLFLIAFAGCAEQKLAQCAEKVITQIGDQGQRLALIRVANGETSEVDSDCRKIADHLQSGLVNAGRPVGKTVVTRDSVALMASETEINFSMSDWVDPDTRLEAGKKLSADVLIIGKYDPDERRVLVRAIHVTTGEILASVFCRGKDLTPWEITWRVLAIFFIGFMLLRFARNRASTFAIYTDYGAYQKLNASGKKYLIISLLILAILTWILFGIHFMP